jgi:hypothetical protein
VSGETQSGVKSGEEDSRGGEKTEGEVKIWEGRVKDKLGVLPEEGTQLAGFVRMDCAENFSSSKITFRDM